MSKIDPKLEIMLRQRGKKRSLSLDEGGDAATAGASPTDGDDPGEELVPILLKFTGELSELTALGFRPETVLQNLATGRIRLADLPALAEHPNLVKLEISRPLYPDLNTSGPSIGIGSVHEGATPMKGAGTIVGVIDSGIDYRHECFQIPGGNSRIAFLWDMKPAEGATGTPPNGFSTGIEYTRDELKTALANSNPLSVVPHEDKNRDSGHGSHVAGIAAGNGRAEGNCQAMGTFVGMAPTADLVVVCLDSGPGDELGESVNLVNAIDYIFKKADEAGKPAAINISLGDNLGAHDGTSLVEQFIDLFLLLGDGRAVIKSAGNEGAARHHAMGTITAGGAQSVNVTFRVPAGVTSRVIIDLWYAGADRFDVTLTPPTGAGLGPVSPGAPFPGPGLGNNNTAFIRSQLNDPDNNDNRIYLEIARSAAPAVEAGTWTLTLTATTLTDGGFHAWIERNTRTRFLPPFVSSDFTLTVPGTARRVITVGAYADRGTHSGQLCDFSSRGPTRDGVIKPEVVAPGDGIMSVRSGSIPGGAACMQLCSDQYHPLPGTSMAAPHVTGLVALMLQKNPTLPIADIRQHLFASTSKDPAVMGALPNSQWGHGIISAPGAVAAVPAVPGGLAGPVEPEVVVSPTNGGSDTQPALGGAPILFDARAPGEIVGLVQRHAPEVRGLINTNRRVAAVWLRHHGPEIVRNLLYASYDPDRPLPEQVNGLPLAHCLIRILAILRRYGSTALQADIQRHGEQLLRLPGLSYNQILSQLRLSPGGAGD
jgi:subtilisin family serine protease